MQVSIQKRCGISNYILNANSFSRGAVRTLAQMHIKGATWKTSWRFPQRSWKTGGHRWASINAGGLGYHVSWFNVHSTFSEDQSKNRDFRVDWNEFVSYLIFGFQEEDPSSQKESLILPISVPPMVRKSEHRSAICCLALLKAKSDQVPIEEVTETVNFSFGGEDSPEASECGSRLAMRVWCAFGHPIWNPFEQHHQRAVSSYFKKYRVTHFIRARKKASLGLVVKQI